MGSVESSFAAVVGDAHKTFYFPASRTGFLHLLPELTSVLFGALGASEERGVLPDVPASTLQFLGQLASPPRGGQGRHRDIADWLESEALHGRVGLDSIGVGRYGFRPDGGGVELPMARASTVVRPKDSGWLVRERTRVEMERISRRSERLPVKVMRDWRPWVARVGGVLVRILFCELRLRRR